MDDMTPTDKLRALLDELGIDYQMHDGGNRVCFNIDYCEQCGDYLKSIDVIGNCVIASQSYLTPEQAIAATVGVGTCKDVCASISEFTCSECGFNCDLMSWISLFDGDDGRHRRHHHGTPNFCPNCGRRCIG